MNWDDLRIFLAVARHGGVTHAAQALALDPATISRRVARLETALGAVLFARSSRGFVATDAGEALIRSAERMESVTLELADSGQASARLRGAVRIGAPDGCANFLLPEVCADLSTAHPDLSLEVIPQSRPFDLQRREVDIAVTVAPPAGKRAAVRRLGDYALIFAAHESLLAGRTAADGLEGLPLTGYVPELLLDPGLDIPTEYRSVEPMLKSSSVMVQWQWIRSGRAAGLLHDFAFPLAPGLVRLVPAMRILRAYYLVSRRQEGPLVSAVLEALHAGLTRRLDTLRAAAAGSE